VLQAREERSFQLFFHMLSIRTGSHRAITVKAQIFVTEIKRKSPLSARDVRGNLQSFGFAVLRITAEGRPEQEILQEIGTKNTKQIVSKPVVVVKVDSEGLWPSKLVRGETEHCHHSSRYFGFSEASQKEKQSPWTLLKIGFGRLKKVRPLTVITFNISQVPSVI